MAQQPEPLLGVWAHRTRVAYLEAATASSTVAAEALDAVELGGRATMASRGERWAAEEEVDEGDAADAGLWLPLWALFGEFAPAQYSALASIVIWCYCLIGCVVLVNLLVAMFADTYARIKSEAEMEYGFCPDGGGLKEYPIDPSGPSCDFESNDAFARSNLAALKGRRYRRDIAIGARRAFHAVTDATAALGASLDAIGAALVYDAVPGEKWRGSDAITRGSGAGTGTKSSTMLIHPARFLTKSAVHS